MLFSNKTHSFLQQHIRQKRSQLLTSNKVEFDLSSILRGGVVSEDNEKTVRKMVSKPNLNVICKISDNRKNSHK